MENKFRAPIVRDLSIMLLLLWAFVQAVVMAYAQEDMRLTYMLMFFCMDAVVLFGFMGHASSALVLSAMLTLIWISYKLYGYYADGALLGLMDYVLIPVPLLGAAAAWMYNIGISGLNMENTMLRRQVEELVLVDEATGLYNVRALYRDLRVMVHYCDRNHLPISLMLIQPRYETELRGMLTDSEYAELRQRIVSILSNSIRVEDKAYSVDDHGTLAVLLTTTEHDSAVVRNRLESMFTAPNAFEGILARGTTVNFRYACKQYDFQVYGNDMMSYKHAVESELVYDV